MAHTKICFIGGGSYNWMPKLLGDLALTADLEGTVVLQDINPAALDDIPIGRALAAAGSRFTIETTTDLDRGLDGAEFVVVTITTGALETMRLDLAIPEKYGIHQSVGDTVGPGGLSRALRNVRVMVGLAQAMERRCPKCLAQPDQSYDRAHPRRRADFADQSRRSVSRAVRRPRRADPHVRWRRRRLRVAGPASIT